MFVRGLWFQLVSLSLRHSFARARVLSLSYLFWAGSRSLVLEPSSPPLPPSRSGLLIYLHLFSHFPYPPVYHLLPDRDVQVTYLHPYSISSSIYSAQVTRISPFSILSCIFLFSLISPCSINRFFVSHVTTNHFFSKQVAGPCLFRMSWFVLDTSSLHTSLSYCLHFLGNPSLYFNSTVSSRL